jgi:NTE family protein
MDIGLALSGGGFRAAAFHAGVLRRLAEAGLLASVKQISTVSSGSLLLSAIISRFGWPTDREYEDVVFPELKRLLTTSDLFSWRALTKVGCSKFYYRLIFDRAEILENLLELRWKVEGLLTDLPDRPVWWINATCLETAKNWRFSKWQMGDRKFSRHYSPRIKIATAAAASAAMPYVIGALRIGLPGDGRRRSDPATHTPTESKDPPYTSIRLWDGGVYENLGLEALFKPEGRRLGCDFLVCSDASRSILEGTRSLPVRLLLGSLAGPRPFDISADQTRSIRSRTFVRAIERGEVRGSLIRLGNSVRDIDTQVKRTRTQANYDAFLRDEEVSALARIETGLTALTPDRFEAVARHGYEVADATLTAHWPEEFPTSSRWFPPRARATTGRSGVEACR